MWNKRHKLWGKVGFASFSTCKNCVLMLIRWNSLHTGQSCLANSISFYFILSHIFYRFSLDIFFFLFCCFYSIFLSLYPIRWEWVKRESEWSICFLFVCPFRHTLWLSISVFFALLHQCPINFAFSKNVGTLNLCASFLAFVQFVL